MLSGFGDKAGAQIVERGHVVEQHAAGAVGPLNLNADLAADDAAEIAGLVQAAVEPEKAARPAAIAQKAFMQAAAGVVVFVAQKSNLAAPDIKRHRRQCGKVQIPNRKHGGAFCHSSVLKAFNASASLPAEQLKQTRAILLRIQSEKCTPVADYIDAARVSEHECFIHVKQEHRCTVAKQQLYAVH